MRGVREVRGGCGVIAGRQPAGSGGESRSRLKATTRRNRLVATPALTRRERQTAELIKSGLSDKEIARRLNISLATTKSHVHNLLGKLSLRRRSEVADHLRGHWHHSR